jgi:type I restriction enzyme M protein
MGYLFEELIRRFSEISNETAGEHYTPREVIRLIVSLLLINDRDALTGSGSFAGLRPGLRHGGHALHRRMEMKALNDRDPRGAVRAGAEPESFAICKSDMLVTGHDPENIAFGNTLTQDAHRDKRFHYMLSNPPYGVDWKKYADPIKAEAESKGCKAASVPVAQDLGRAAALPAAHDLEDARRRAGLAHRHRHERLAPLHRWRRFRRERDPPLDAGERLGRGHHRPAHRPFLQHRHPDLCMAADQPESPARRGKVQLIDASGRAILAPMRKSWAPSAGRSLEDARDEIARIYSGFLTAMAVGRRLQDLRHHRLRLPRDPGRAAPEAGFQSRKRPSKRCAVLSPSEAAGERPTAILKALQERPA